MLAYNKNSLERFFLWKEAGKLFRAKQMSAENFNAADGSLIDFKHQENIFARIGLFFLGILQLGSIYLVISILSFISLVGGFETAIAILFFFFSLISIGALEYVIYDRKYLKYGLDDAFLLWTQINLVVFVCSFNLDNEYLIFGSSAVISALCSIRYINLFSLVISFCSLMIFIANILLQSGSLGRNIAPFVFMAIALILIRTVNNFKKKKVLNFIWNNHLQTIYTCSLLLFYAAGNYFVVRELSGQVFIGEYEIDIPFAWFFYLFTFLVPLFYIVYSLKIHSKILLWVGALTLVLSIATIRFYYSVLPVEYAMLIGGVVTLSLALFGLYKLRNKAMGLTAKKDDFEHFSGRENLEIFDSLQRLSVTPVEMKNVYNGGDSGGGGAENSF